MCCGYNSPSLALRVFFMKVEGRILTDRNHIFKGCGVYFWRDFRCSNNFSIFSKTSFLLHFLHISHNYASHWREITTPVFPFIGLFFQALSLYTCSQVQKEEKHLYSFPENIKGKCSVCILQQTY